jgi:O-antigen ligase
MRLVMAGYIVAGPVGILLTGSRTATTVGVAALLVVLVTFRQVPVPSRAAVMVVVAAGLMLLPGTLAGETTQRAFSGLSSDEGRELQTRADLFDIALDEMAERPLLGTGRGVVREVSSLDTGDSELSSHNSFFNIGAEFGIPALALYMAMWILAAATAFRSSGMERLVALTVLALVVGGSLVVNFELEKANWFALGIALVLTRRLPTDGDGGATTAEDYERDELELLALDAAPRSVLS